MDPSSSDPSPSATASPDVRYPYEFLNKNRSIAWVIILCMALGVVLLLFSISALCGWPFYCIRQNQRRKWYRALASHVVEHGAVARERDPKEPGRGQRLATPGPNAPFGRSLAPPPGLNAGPAHVQAQGSPRQRPLIM